VTDSACKSLMPKTNLTSLCSNFISDDAIGRVAVQLGRLVSGCEYDCWFQLGLGAISAPDGSLGHVRLRFSLTFKSERMRMLAYIHTPPVHALPFHKAAKRKLARFSKHGKLASEKYDWDVLMSYVDEAHSVLQHIICLVAAVESIILWRRKWLLYSIGNLIGVQIIITLPQLIPSWFGILVLTLLYSTYSIPHQDPRQDLPIHAQATFNQSIKQAINQSGPADPRPGDVRTVVCSSRL